MLIIYNLGIWFYASFIYIASHWNEKAKDWWQGRAAKTWKNIDFQKDDWYWFHCASLGEFDQAIPLIEEVKRQKKGCKILVTFFSPSGMKHYHKRNVAIDFACFLPIDTKRKAEEFIKHINPQKAFFIKYEFWHYHLVVCRSLSIELFSVCSIFRENQSFFKPYGTFFRRSLSCFTGFFVQNEKSKILLNEIGIQNVEVVGDLRIERVVNNSKKASADEKMTHFKGDKKIFIVGSSWPIDEKIVLPVMNEFTSHKIIIAPHNISEKYLLGIENQLTRPFCRYTGYSEAVECEVLILDTIGHLMNAYSQAEVAYVGGGFTGKLHNILEPIAFKVPVLFGPKHSKFPEAKQFVERGFGFEILDSSDLLTTLNRVSTDLEITDKIDAFLLSQESIAQKIVEHIN